MARWFLTAVLAIVLGHGHMWPFLAWLAGLVAVFYFISLHRHPRRVCRSCGGTGRHKGAMFFWGDRACTACGGGSRHRRWGAQLLFREPQKLTWAERGRASAGKRRSAPR